MIEVFIKIHKDQNHSLIAACDKNLIGKTYHEGKLRLEVKEEFYGDNLYSVEEAVNLLNDAKEANLVGEKIIKATIEKKLIDSRAVIYIAGIPHVQIMNLGFLHSP